MRKCLFFLFAMIFLFRVDVGARGGERGREGERMGEERMGGEHVGGEQMGAERGFEGYRATGTEAEAKRNLDRPAANLNRTGLGGLQGRGYENRAFENGALNGGYNGVGTPNIYINTNPNAIPGDPSQNQSVQNGDYIMPL